MCQEGRRAAAEDETWDIDSSTDGDSSAESGPQTDGRGRAAPPSFRAAARPDPRSRVAHAAVAPSSHPPQAAMKQEAPPARAIPKVSVGSLLQQPSAARAMANQVLGNAQAGGLMALVTHLRADNARLREALVAAQREAEALMEEQRRRGAAAEQPSVDFGHLLELVRDFGADGLGGSDEDYALEGPLNDTAQVFSMDSPRGERCEPSDAELSNLREELEESKAEAARLRAELEAARAGTVM
mmetsp:Transcript_40425/g.116843  ORF Transcript_40425/g.116843 Transcript_40425/m.116843 type:complete len:242 (-) Transcript_40425:211-936(-)